MNKTLKILGIAVVCILILFCYSLIKTIGNNNQNKNVTKQKPITLTMFCEDLNPNEDGFKNPIAKEITKETGVTLKI